MSLKLWLIRHGQTSVNSGQWSAKPMETRLTALGQEQAKCAAKQIEEQPNLIIVSPLIRAQDTASFLFQRWPQSMTNIWPIQEFIYLSPTEMHQLAENQRRQLVDSYWQKKDPLYCHSHDTESFAAFLERVAHFHSQLSYLEGFVVVIGHGQFFKAFQLGLEHGFEPSPAWMQMYRENETSNPIKNGEIVKINFNR